MDRIEKPCRKCKTLFCPTPAKLKRGDYLCVSCAREEGQFYLNKRRAEGKRISGNRQSPEKERAYRKLYCSKPETRKMRSDRARLRRLDPKERPKNEARWLLSRALKRGDIKRLPCEVCGETKVDGHHDDYSKPLEVRWLCRAHHAKLHKELKGKAVS